ncbi:MAG: porin [Gammaproteobacteria bacterium]|nr:porin [Gammaproteobacteria bacterium]
MQRFNKTKLTSLIILLFLQIPVCTAVEIAKGIHFYGKIHLSFDNSNDGDKSNKSLSSNASRVGFKGIGSINSNLEWLWQLEQTVRFDQTGGQFATRNSYLGLQIKQNHKFIFGHHDTPYKLSAGYWGLFSDTVADRLALLGASQIDNFRMNDRGENAILYIGNYQPIEIQLMYSASNPNNSTSGSVDDNETDMSSAGIFYRKGPWYLALAYEEWSGMNVTNINTTNLERTQVSGWRGAFNYTFGQHRFGMVYENISPGDITNFPHWDRDVYGINYKYDMTKDYYLASHLLKVTEYYGSSNTDASHFGIGVFYTPDKQSEIYLAYAITNNNSNASYNVADGGHGDVVFPVAAGEDPQSISLGLAYKF